MSNYAPVVATGTGSTAAYAIPWPYIDKAHVIARVNDVIVEFNWLDSQNIEFIAIPADGYQIVISRETPDYPAVEFATGQIEASKLTLASRQALYRSGESVSRSEAIAEAIVDEVEEFRDETLAAAEVVSDAAAGVIAAVATVTSAASTATTAASQSQTNATTASDAASTATTRRDETVAAATAAGIDADATQAARVAVELTYNAMLNADLGGEYVLPSATDPTTRNDGSPLVGGEIYYNTASPEWRRYTGTDWTAAFGSGVIALPIAGGVMEGPITLNSDPSAPLHAATKQYVDARVARAGDTMTGPLILTADPSVALMAATKQYVDNHDWAIGDVAGLQAALDAKALASHTHAFSSLTGIPTTLAGYGITDAATSAQVQSNVISHATSVGGTPDAITATFTPAFTAYTGKMKFRFTSSGANTITNPTINVDGLGTKTIKKLNGVALVPGDIAGAGHVCECVYNGTDVLLINPAAQVASGVWEKFGIFSIPASSATFDITGLPAFSVLRLTFLQIQASAAASLQMRVSIDNGATFISTTNYAVAAEDTAAVAVGVSTLNLMDTLTIAAGLANAADGHLTIHKHFDATSPIVFGVLSQMIGKNASNQRFCKSLHGSFNSGTSIFNAIRLLMSAGNIDAGKVIIEYIA